MSVKLREQLKSSNLIELKAGAFTFPVLRLLQYRPEEMCLQLAEKIAQAPEMFRNAPLAIDVSALPENIGPADFENLIRIIDGLGIRPLGIRGGSSGQRDSARAAGLAVLSESGPRVKGSPQPESSRSQPVEQPVRSSKTVNRFERSPSTLISKPVRSGQSIYAENGDLIILATVSAGAEIIADGNIHVYGSLRGRALAGVKGDLQTRIFCSDLQAELVSISGQYQISEGIDSSLRGKPVQIYLSGESLLIEKL
ncbi:MAG: septum site-determining protein MinC [Methylococcaceae bacterium]|nr:septum site-determining protein MinC [Methylococcaceae bacterium]